LSAHREERIDIAHGDLREGALREAEPLSKLSRKPGVLTDDLTGQASVVTHAGGKSLDQEGKRSSGGLWLSKSTQESQPVSGSPNETQTGSLSILSMLSVGLRLYPSFGRRADGLRIDCAMRWEFKSVSNDSQFLRQVLKRCRRKTDGRAMGEVALTFFNQGGFLMAREHPWIREELLKHSWISSASVSSEIQPIPEKVMWRSFFAYPVVMRLCDTSTTYF
jgi:hypothetical protein